MSTDMIETKYVDIKVGEIITADAECYVANGLLGEFIRTDIDVVDGWVPVSPSLIGKIHECQRLPMRRPETSEAVKQPDLSYLPDGVAEYLRERGYEPLGRGERGGNMVRGWLFGHHSIQDAFTNRLDPGWLTFESHIAGNTDHYGNVLILFRKIQPAEQSQPTPAEPEPETEQAKLVRCYRESLKSERAANADVKRAMDARQHARAERRYWGRQLLEFIVKDGET